MGRRAPREAAGTPAFLAALVSPDYRRLWGATACSQAAVWALVVLRGALVYEVTTSNAWVGFVTMAAQLPSLVVTPFAGLLADRCERRHLLALTYGLNLGNTLLLAVLVMTRQITAWPIVVLALCNGILRAVEMPTKQALLPNLVPRERLLNAVALNQLVQQPEQCPDGAPQNALWARPPERRASGRTGGRGRLQERARIVSPA